MAETGQKKAPVAHKAAEKKQAFDDYVLNSPIMGSKVVTHNPAGLGEVQALEFFEVASKGDKLPADMSDMAEEYAKESIIIPKNLYDMINNPEEDQFLRSTSLVEHEARAQQEMAGYSKSQLQEIEEAAEEAVKLQPPTPPTHASAGQDKE